MFDLMCYSFIDDNLHIYKVKDDTKIDTNNLLKRAIKM